MLPFDKVTEAALAMLQHQVVDCNSKTSYCTADGSKKSFHLFYVRRSISIIRGQRRDDFKML